MPLAYTDDGQLEREIEVMRESGIGGAEVHPLKVTGGVVSTPQALDQYGWGTPTFAHKVSVMAEAAASNDFILDQNLGAWYPPTVPTITDINHPATEKQLLFGQRFVTAGNAVTGPIPAPTVAPATGAALNSIGTVAVKCVAASCATDTGTKQLDPSTLVKLSETGGEQSGQLNWTAPGGSGTWVVLSYYWASTGTKLTGYTNPAGFVTDHLSAEGAKVITDYFDAHVLDDPGVKALITEINKTGTATFFEDSLELSAAQKWTPDMVEQWSTLRGYDVLDVLPAVAGSGAQGTTAPPFDFGDGLGERAREDYRNMWSDLYVTRYMNHYQDWAEGYGMGMRAQSYGSPIDSSFAASTITIPEHESIAANNNNEGWAEAYKVLSSGANYTGSILSSECCAVFSTAYSTRIEGPTGDADTINNNAGVLGYAYQAFSAGVSQLVLHGWTYQNAPTAAWPGDHAWAPNGSTAFNVSDAFGPQNPNWDDMKDVIESLSRTQLVLRQGEANHDVAVYFHDFGMKGTSNGISTTGAQLGQDNALGQNGFSYNYLSPELLTADDASYSDGELLAGKGDYKSIVLNNQKSLTLEAATKLLTLAKADLPIVFVGELPSQTKGALDVDAQDAELAEVIAELDALVGDAGARVAKVADEAAVPAALRSLGVNGSVGKSEASPAIQFVRRSTADTDYYFLYNQYDEPVSQTLELAGEGVPFELNTWHGTIDRVAAFSSTEGGVSLPVQLDGNQAVVYAVSTASLDGATPAAAHVTTTEADATVLDEGSPSLRAAQGGDYVSQLSDGSEVSTTIGDVDAAQPLNSWTLDVERWSAGPNAPSHAQTPASPVFTTVKTDLDPIPLTADADGRLPSWRTGIPGLEDATGFGTYSTTFTTSAGWKDGQGAYLNLGAVTDTASITVNGKTVPPVDQGNKNGIDIGRFVTEGTNEVSIKVAVPVMNAWSQVGGRRGPVIRDVGLYGPVTVQPYRQVAVDDTAPTVSVSTEPRKPNGNKGWFTEAVKVSASAVDNGTGKPVVEVKVGADGSWKPLTKGIVINKDGTHELFFRAIDALGTVSDETSRIIKFDAGAPTSSADVDEEERTLGIESVDGTSGVSEIQYRITDRPGARASAAAAEGWTEYTDPLSLGDEAVTVQFRAIDVAGNTESVQRVAIDAAAAVVPTTSAPSDGSDPSAPGDLAQTGNALVWVGLIALLLLLAGGSAVLIARRKAGHSRG